MEKNIIDANIETKFSIDSKVKIIRGFFKNKLGHIVDFRKSKDDIILYDVIIKENDKEYKIEVNEENLKLEWTLKIF